MWVASSQSDHCLLLVPMLPTYVDLLWLSVNCVETGRSLRESPPTNDV